MPIVLLAALVVAPARGDGLARAEVARQGKAATALVQLRPTTVAGTAFSVHPAGYFLTADAVVAGGPEDAEVTLVLDPGLKTQKVLKARLVRRDKELGLALLHAEGGKDLPSLPLGAVDQLSELKEFVFLGFPSGGSLAEKDPDYPAVTVDVGTVTSLRRKDGEPAVIDMKAGTNPVTPGGPVLDDRAAVVGVIVQSGREGITRSVPVNRLARFLAAPDLQLTAPALTRTNEHQPAEFQATAVSVIPAPRPLSVELVLRAGDDPERRQKMDLKGGIYRVTAIPVPPDEERRLELFAQFETGTLTGLVADREIQVGAQKVKLSACRRLQFQPRPAAVLGDGKTLEGAATGLERVEFLVGGQPVTLSLSRATALRVVAPGPVAAVDCTLIARHDDQEVGRFQTRLPVRGVTLVAPGDPAAVAIQPPDLEAEKVVKELPDLASDIRVGGGGRYLVLHLPKLKKLAVFDVNEAAIVRYIPLTEDKVFYAAGLDKVVVGLSTKGVLERWDLATGEKELTRPMPGLADVTAVCMGSASHGPVVVNADTVFDLDTLRPLPIRFQHGGPVSWSPVAADGTVFGAWKPNQSPTESISFVLEGDELKRYEGGELGHIVPGPDGRVVYTNQGVRTNRLAGLKGGPPKPGYCLPAVEGNFYFTLTPAEGGKGGSLAVYLLGNEQPLVKDVGFTHGIHFDGWDRNFFGPWKRIFFIPRAKLIIVFPESNDRLELHRFDVEEALEKSGLDYLLVTSRPPATATRGGEYTYQVAVKSKAGGVRYQLAAGPERLEVSPGGLVKWRVPADFKGNEGDVILTIRDASGQEVFHTFTIRISDG
jgi:hypothetical protein